MASLVTCSRTSAGEVFEVSQDGGVRRYGSADLEIPFLRGATGGRQRKPQPAALMATGSSISGAVARHGDLARARGAPLAVHTPHGGGSCLAFAAAAPFCSGEKACHDVGQTGGEREPCDEAGVHDARRKSQQASTTAAQRPDSPPEGGAGSCQQRGRGDSRDREEACLETRRRGVDCNAILMAWK